MRSALSKRVQHLAHLRQSFLMAGVFLVVALSIPVKTYALSPAFNSSLKPGLPAVQDNQIQIEKLQSSFKTKQQLIDEKQKQLEKVIDQSKDVVQTREDLEKQVNDAKEQVKQLQAQVDEKNRLEALRIVHIKEYAGNAAGNEYAWGNCTWYAKSRRPDLPNDLGNANMWLINAAAQGWKTGTQARTGAIGVTTRGWLGHVVYVEAWHNDGTITISEMNAQGLNVTDTTTANESDFQYIYEKP